MDGTRWIAVDWGTSKLRAWGIGDGGETTFAAVSDDGMARLSRDGFAPALLSLLAPKVAIEGPLLDVLICGMAGARQGWMEAPYLDVPAQLDGLAGHAVRPPMPDSRLRPLILPGACQRVPGAEDVMRGEETQLLGLTALDKGFRGVVVMPGTHSKWAEVDDARLMRFATAMTGELFEVLRAHSVLRHSTGGVMAGPDHRAGFDEGLEGGLARPGRLTSELFKIRAGSLLAGKSAPWCSGYLSGLLIGSEIGGHRDWLGGGATVPLVGGAALCALYAAGFERVGAATRIIDAAEATLAGLKRARDALS